jgi:hypothetical protein
MSDASKLHVKVRLVAILEEQKLRRVQKEEDKRRYRVWILHHVLLLALQSRQMASVLLLHSYNRTRRNCTIYCSKRRSWSLGRSLLQGKQAALTGEQVAIIQMETGLVSWRPCPAGSLQVVPLLSYWHHVHTLAGTTITSRRTGGWRQRHSISRQLRRMIACLPLPPLAARNLVLHWFCTKYDIATILFFSDFQEFLLILISGCNISDQGGRLSWREGWR